MLSFRKLTLISLSLFCFTTIYSYPDVENLTSPTDATDNDFTVIPYNYAQVTQQSAQDIKTLLRRLRFVSDPNRKMQLISQFFQNKPYATSGAEGEGDWCNATQRDCVHIQQDPIYRTDTVNCFTLMQTVLALFHTTNLKQYNQNILAIAYGAANQPASNTIHYYNRNNFVSGDFNPINERQNKITDITSFGPFAAFIQYTIATIDRENWFAFQEKAGVIGNNVRVINAVDGPAMYERFVNSYPEAAHPFIPVPTPISYIPKEVLATPITEKNGQIDYAPNETLINQIPVPTIVEIVRDASKWNINGVNIKDIIGTELNISHVGLLYRQTFKPNDIIYQNTICSLDNNDNKVCTVAPVICLNKNGCTETMFLDATSAYPSGYYYYQSPANSNHYVCTATPAPPGVPSTTCNRVMALPLGDYLTTYQYGSYIFMTSPSIVGIHVEKIN